jgi:hypothetical protein
MVGGDSAEILIPPPGEGERLFAFSLHKAGSVMLDRIITDMAEVAGIPAINIASQLFRQGFVEALLPPEVVGPVLMRDGYVFMGFRGLAPYISAAALDGRRKALLIRDPRDMLVSLYFSHRYSHAVPRKGGARDQLLALRSDAGRMEIDDYVLSDQPRFMIDNYRAYMRAVGPDWRVYRYEDVIFRKRDWLADLAAFFQMDVGWDQLDRIADKHDLRPAEENVNAHVRQVTPGNHRKHLRARTIERLNETLADILCFHEANRP